MLVVSLVSGKKLFTKTSSRNSSSRNIKQADHQTILLNNVLVQHITTKKYLGLHYDEENYIDKEITFKYHVNKQINIAHKKVGIIVNNLSFSRKASSELW